jgi:adenosylcobalamin-dependent ribonucleoside-triphosphate reductase
VTSPSIRAQVITRRTYNRELPDGSYETWEQTVDRVIDHQKWLWQRALEKSNGKWRDSNEEELGELRDLMLERKAVTSGRTLWLGGTEVSKRREASQFNCSFVRIETVHDIVDAYWLLLQGCGVGFEPIVGTLNGWTKPVYCDVIRSTKTDHTFKGNPNTTTEWTQNVKGEWDTWTIKVGDSAEAWAKLPGKLLAEKRPFNRLVLDFSEIRPAGTRLSSYGWISSGDELIAQAMVKIATILNLRATKLLTRLDIMDIMNWLGSTLSSRRSAEITLVPYGDPEWVEFARAKKDYWLVNPQRAQSNNSIVFYHRPSKSELHDIFNLMLEAGGSEPGFINGAAALKRAPWFKGVNPCAEILLGNRSFCNLVEINLAAFNGDWEGLLRAVTVVSRANYRQTCVNLDDGILQRTWHELNEFLRLTGVGLTGIVRWEYHNDGAKFKALHHQAHIAVHKQADELKAPRSRAVCTIKPSGTLSKIMDTTEGLHKPLGRYIFNNVKFSIHDPLVKELQAAGYHTFNRGDATIVRFPVEWTDVEFMEFTKYGSWKKKPIKLHVNLESAVKQLERYKLVMENYVDHNASITVSYSPGEVPEIVDWIYDNWDTYVGVSFMLRVDPTLTAQELGHPYLPQEVVTQEDFEAYVSTLKPIGIYDHGGLDIDVEECVGGACPVR